MSATTIITGTPGTTVAASYTGPDMGTEVDAEDVNGALEGVADDIATLDAIKANLDGGTTFTGGIVKATEYQFTNPVSVTRTGYSTPLVQSGSWAFSPAGTGVWKDTSTNGVLWIPVDVPAGAILQTVDVYLDPANTHGGSLPASMPSIVLWKRTLSTNATTPPTQTGGVDTSANATAYEAVHAVTLTLTGGHTVNRAAAAYYVLLTGESGLHAQNDLTYVGISYSYDVTEVGQD